ncbi:MAG TPA: S41 family peptidase [Terriglobia bacterium]|nr:S41 family peptidase [Terriglobia bacterium]
MKRNSGAVWLVIAAVALGALAGGLRGQVVRATSPAASDSEVQADLQQFTHVYSVIEGEYADRLNPDRAIYGLDIPASPVGAIPGMLRPLDPHSDFFGPAAFSLIREQQAVKYYGVGIGIYTRLDRSGKLCTFVPNVIPGTPAFAAGVRPGDIIRKVDGKSVAGLSLNQVSNLLRGPRGTTVQVTFEREGYDAPVEFTITRDEIKNPTVDAAFVLKSGVAYVHINNFYETTDDELSTALRSLEGKGLKGLVLDLRDNPGGLVDEAVAVSDHFLPKGQLIVYQYGRSAREQRYYATRGNHGDEYPMVVLVNRYTASAAEIVTGALQDHDRALVLGEPSFGKGLVQSVYTLSEHTGLALTTAHYYTPSGRLIQRDYSKVSPYDYFYRAENAPSPRGEVRRTDGGREVFGGGGITPDVEMPVPVLNAVRQKLADRSAIYGFAEYYLGAHKTIPRDFQVTPDVLDGFYQYLTKENIPLTSADLQDNLDYVKEQIREQLVSFVYGQDQELRLKAEDDPLVAKAVDSMPQAAALLTHAKQFLASRKNGADEE